MVTSRKLFENGPQLISPPQTKPRFGRTIWKRPPACQKPFQQLNSMHNWIAVPGKAQYHRFLYWFSCSQRDLQTFRGVPYVILQSFNSFTRESKTKPKHQNQTKTEKHRLPTETKSKRELVNKQFVFFIFKKK